MGKLIMVVIVILNVIILKGFIEIVVEFFCKYIVFKLFYNKNCKVVIWFVKDFDY